MRYKSNSQLTGAAWMRDQLIRQKALMQTPMEERAAALMDFCDGDQRMFKELYAGVVVKERRDDFWSDLGLAGGISTKAAPAVDIFDTTSNWLLANGGEVWL